MMVVPFNSTTYKQTICLDMRRDVQAIFKQTPTEKQVMMFSATLPRELRTICKKFMNSVSPHYLSTP